MSKGLKRICMSCGMRFYDLDKSPIICPGCETEFTGEEKIKTRRGRVSAIAEEPVKQAPRSSIEDDEDEIDDIDPDDDIVSLDDVDEDDLDDDDEDALGIDSDDLDDLDEDDLDDLDDEDLDDEDEEDEDDR
ncbi:MAG: FYDLN acid domain-containing protein [Alphaproteobacteria bacterium]|nr:FYDLN acid domain-containing protein [Alphaproteobacteria bacterium]